MSTPNELVLRCQFESYMKCGINTPSFYLIGEGFTAFPEAKNPVEYTRKYINDKTERTDVIGYAPSISYSCDAIKDDPCVQKIMEITDKEYLGVNTYVEIVNVNCWEQTNSNEYKACKRTYAVIPDTKGDGTEALIYSGTLKAVSDPVYGAFNRSTFTFIEDPGSSSSSLSSGS